MPHPSAVGTSEPTGGMENAMLQGLTVSLKLLGESSEGAKWASIILKSE
jgi:hypothetical protein